LKETIERGPRGFIRHLPPWIFLAVLLASLDLHLRLNSITFVSTADWIYFVMGTYGIYLSAVISSYIIIRYIVSGIMTLVHARGGIGMISLALFIACATSLIIIGTTGVSITSRTWGNVFSLALTAIGSAACGILVSRIILYSYASINSIFWALFIGLLLSPGITHFASTYAHPHINVRIQKPSSYPNVVLILIDALRADRMGCYNNESTLTPNIDNFARDSAVFLNVTSQSSWTKTNEFYPLGKIFFLDKVYRRKWIDRPPYPDGTRLASWAVEWIEHSKARPFFLYLHIMDVHDPYRPPPPFDRKYLNEKDRRLDRDELWAREREFRRSNSPLTAYLPAARALYNGSVNYTDTFLGNFLDFLDRAGLMDSSLVIITADHGEEFLEHDGTTHGKTLYEEVLRTPLIMRFPGMPSGGMRVKEPVELVDIVPTIMDVLGIKSQLKSDGTSLMPLLRGTGNGEWQREERPILSELHFADDTLLESVKSGGWKLILTRRFNKDKIEPSYELYELTGDPAETHNLIDSKREIAKHLSGYLPAKEREGRSNAFIPNELEHQLESLGYITK